VSQLTFSWGLRAPRGCGPHAARYVVRVKTSDEIKRLTVLEVPLERDGFLRSLVRHLSGALQDVVGLAEASGFVTIVGQRMGDEINTAYRAQYGAKAALTRAQVTAVLVDLKRRIQGDFYVIDESEDRIVLGNRACPFGDRVRDRPALCMMTSNVFGRIASENLGYAKVVIDKAIANHDPECRVIVYLQASDESRAADGREYIKG
jgi:predicted ArsR family transcriptional regulator